MVRTRAERMTDLLRFLRTIQKPGAPIETLDEATSLVESGLIDSLAVLEIVVYLEETCGIAFAERGLDPGELVSVGAILDLIDRETG
jgi:acyl carrier protein